MKSGESDGAKPLWKLKLSESVAPFKRRITDLFQLFGQLDLFQRLAETKTFIRYGNNVLRQGNAAQFLCLIESKTLNKLCEVLDCSLEDIAEFVKDEE